MSPEEGRISWTALVALAAGAVAFVPGAAELLALDRDVVASGAAWPLLTGHLVHWSTGQLLWDVGTFAALGFASERVARSRVAPTLLASAALVSAAFWFALPDLAAYRGLSGVDCALGGLLAGSLLRTALEDGRLRGAAVAAGIATFLAGKIAWEVGTGGTLFVPSMGTGVVAVPLAHAVGGAVGALIGSWPRRGVFARLWRWIGRLESPKLPIVSTAATGRSFRRPAARLVD